MTSQRSAETDSTGGQFTARTLLIPTANTAVVALAALVLGGLTSPAQQYLPEWLTSFANSAGGWTALTFGLVFLARARAIPSAVMGVVAFVLLVEGYRIMSGWRGFYYSEPFQDEFTVIGVIAGPVIGAAACLIRSSSHWWRALSAVPVPAVLIGEGVIGLTVIASSTSPVYWALQILAGGVLLALALRVQGMPTRIRAVAVIGVVVGVIAFDLFYVALGSAI